MTSSCYNTSSHKIGAGSQSSSELLHIATSTTSVTPILTTASYDVQLGSWLCCAAGVHAEQGDSTYGFLNKNSYFGYNVGKKSIRTFLLFKLDIFSTFK